MKIINQFFICLFAKRLCSGPDDLLPVLKNYGRLTIELYGQKVQVLTRSTGLSFYVIIRYNAPIVLTC